VCMQVAVHALSILAAVAHEPSTLGLARVLTHCEEIRRILEHALVRWKLSNEQVSLGCGRYVETSGQVCCAAHTYTYTHTHTLTHTDTHTHTHARTHTHTHTHTDLPSFDKASHKMILAQV